jgi:hypothetical protein
MNMKSLFNFLRQRAGVQHTTSEIQTLTIPTQAPPIMTWMKLGDEIGNSEYELAQHLIVNEHGLYFCQFPNLEPDWCRLDLKDFVPQHEFPDCVFGEIMGSKIKLFKAEYTYQYTETLSPIGGGWL